MPGSTNGVARRNPCQWSIAMSGVFTCAAAVTVTANSGRRTVSICA
jgi:hypothetical protein